MPPPLASAPGLIDWGIVCIFLLSITGFGMWISHRGSSQGKDFFLGGRNIPSWAAAISLVATSLSAATFIGGPADSFKGDLSYLILNVGMIGGGLLAAYWIIPAAWRCGGETPYALLEQRGGAPARQMAGGVFLFGRLLASGARHMITGTAFCFLAFGELRHEYACAAIIVCGLLGTLYAAKGGIKAVIWTDLALFLVLVVSVIACFFVIQRAVPAEGSQIISAMRAHDKLTLLNLSIDPSHPYTLWAGCASVLFFAAAYGADQDLAQRMLTTRSPQHATRSLVTGVLATLPLNVLFLLLGVCLWVYYRQPELMGAAGDETVADPKMVFPQFIRDHLPVGLKGLMMAGLAATSLGALASAISAMAASVCTDFAHVPGIRGMANHPRSASVLMGTILTGVALGCYAAIAINPSTSLIQFALGIVTLAYTGLLGVFACVLLTRRGSPASIVAALLVGASVAITLFFLHVVPMVATGPDTAMWAPERLGEPDIRIIWKKLAFPWVMLVGSLLTFGICCLGKPR